MRRKNASALSSKSGDFSREWKIPIAASAKRFSGRAEKLRELLSGRSPEWKFSVGGNQEDRERAWTGDKVAEASRL